MNVEQAPKRVMRVSTFRRYGEDRCGSGRERQKHRDRLAGVLALARMEDQGSGNTGSPVGAVARSNRDPARGKLGRQGGGWARTTEDAG